MKKFHMPLAMKAAKVNEKSISHLQHKGIEDIIFEEHPTMNTIKHYMGEPMLIILMIGCVTEIFQWVTAGKKIEADVIAGLCRMILEDYDWLTIADLKLCFKRGVKGNYGSDFDRLDAPVIFGWIENYRKQRLRVSEELRRLQKKEKEGNGVAMPLEIKEKMEQLEKNLQMKGVKENVKQNTVDWEEDLRARDKSIREMQERVLSQVNQEG